MVVDFQWLWLATGPYQQLTGDRASTADRAASAVDAKVLGQIAAKAPGFRGRILCANGQLVHLASGDRRSVIVGAIPTVEVKPGTTATGGSMGCGMGGGGMFSVADDPFGAGPSSPAKPAAKERAATCDTNPFVVPTASPPSASPAPAVPPAAPAVNVQNAPPPVPVIAGRTAYQPVIDVPNAGVVVEVRPTVAPGADTAVLDVRSSVTRWGPPAAPARVGSPGSAACPVDRPNIAAAEMATTVRVPLGKPVLVGAVTFASAGGAGLDKPTENPLHLCLIATTSIAAGPKPAKKR